MIRPQLKMFVLLFFLIVAKSIACQGQYFLLYKNGKIERQDSLVIRNGKVLSYSYGSLHDMAYEKLEGIVLADSLMEFPVQEKNFELEAKYKTGKEAFGLYYLDKVPAVPDSLAVSQTYEIVNKKGEAYFAGGIGLSANNFSYLPHWSAFGQVKFAGSPVLIDYEYAKKLFPSDELFMYRSFNKYQKVGLGYQLKGKSILKTHSNSFTATFLKANFSWGKSRFRYWDLFYVGQIETAPLYCATVGFQWITVNPITFFSVELGAGYAERADSDFGMNTKLLALNFSLKLGLNKRL